MLRVGLILVSQRTAVALELSNGYKYNATCADGTMQIFNADGSLNIDCVKAGDGEAGTECKDGEGKWTGSVYARWLC